MRFLAVLALILCHEASSKTLIFEAHNDKFVALDQHDSKAKQEFPMEFFTIDKFPKKYESVSTVIMYGENVNTTVNHNLHKYATAIFDRITAVDELIVIEIVPDAYFLGLNYTEIHIKYLTLYSYLGSFFNKPCDLFPNLEELTIELTEMDRMDLSSCHRLKKVWVRGFFATSDSADRASADKDRVDALMESIRHLLHDTKARSSELGMWDRSMYEKELKESKNRLPLTNINDYALETILTDKLEFIEVAPCSAELFSQIIKKVDQQNTVIHAHIDNHEFVGNVNQYYIYIYDMEVRPSQPLYSLPENSTYLGLRFDNASLSQDWWDFLFRFRQLELFVFDCKLSVLAALLRRPDEIKAFLPNLSVLAITVSSEHVTETNGLQNNLQRTVNEIFVELPMIENVIFQFVGFGAMDLGSKCQNMGVEQVNGRSQITFNCFNENKQEIEEIAVVDIEEHREVRAINDDDDDEKEWTLSYQMQDDKKFKAKYHVSEATEEIPETNDVENGKMEAGDGVRIETYPENDQTYSFIRDIIGKTVDTCRKIGERWFWS